MEWENELEGSMVQDDDGPSRPLKPLQHCTATLHHRPTHRCQLRRVNAVLLPGSLLVRDGDVSSTSEHGQCGELGGHFNNLRMGTPLLKSSMDDRTAFRTNRTLLWIILVFVWSVTWPLAAHGKSITKENRIRKWSQT